MITRRSLVLGGLAGLAATALDGCSRSTPNLGGNGRPRKEFGVALDPWQAKDWGTTVGANPTMAMEFESWNMNRDISTHFRASTEKGMDSYMLTWEPWTPVDASLGAAVSERAQPTYSNAAIAAGGLDAYIEMFAKSIRDSKLSSFYLRFAHEMNGNWYPWSLDPAAYIAGWKHVVDVFRSVGANNVRFVWSPNASLYLDDATWLAGADVYWPGPSYVDYVGTTMLNLGGQKESPVAQFVPRLNLMHQHYGKEVLPCEVNTDFADRVVWLADLRTWLSTAQASWCKGMVLSQLPSRAQIQLSEAGVHVGNMNWKITGDKASTQIIKALIEDIT